MAEQSFQEALRFQSLQQGDLTLIQIGLTWLRIHEARWEEGQQLLDAARPGLKSWPGDVHGCFFSAQAVVAFQIGQEVLARLSLREAEQLMTSLSEASLKRELNIAQQRLSGDAGSHVVFRTRSRLTREPHVASLCAGCSPCNRPGRASCQPTGRTMVNGLFTAS